MKMIITLKVLDFYPLGKLLEERLLDQIKVPFIFLRNFNCFPGAFLYKIPGVLEFYALSPLFDTCILCFQSEVQSHEALIYVSFRIVFSVFHVSNTFWSSVCLFCCSIEVLCPFFLFIFNLFNFLSFSVFCVIFPSCIVTPFISLLVQICPLPLQHPPNKQNLKKLKETIKNLIMKAAV